MASGSHWWGVMGVLVVVSVSAISQAAPTKSTVQEAIKKDDGAQIDITGVVLRQVGPRTVLVHDGTAAVEVDVPPDQIPEGGLRPNVRLRIRGELVKDEDGENTELDANQIFWSF